MSNVVRSAAVRLTLENSGYIRGANQSAAVTEAATARIQRSVRNAAVYTDRDWETMGKYGGRYALAVGAGLAAVVKTTADFASEMALVRTLSHANASDMDALSKAALTVGQNIGYSAREVAQGEEEMIKAGISVKDILGGGLKGALDLAAAGQTDVATATSIAASAMTEFKLQGKDIPHIADLLSAGADKALGSVEDLGYGLEQSGTTAHQMGLSIEQTVGTLAAFAQAGLTGERGGTTFKQMLLQLAAPTSVAQKLMDKYGISLYNANGQIKTMPQLAGNLKQALGDLTPAQRNAALGVIFGSRAIQGANILMADGRTEIAKWIDKVNDQGFAAGQASGKLDSLSGDVKKFKATLQTTFIEAGSPSQKALREMVQDADHLVKAFSDLPDSVQQGVVKILALTATIGGALYVAGKLHTAVRELSGGGLGRGKGAAGALGGVARGLGSPVPVYVVNMGAGGLGAGGGPLGTPIPGEEPGTGRPGKVGKVGTLGKITGFAGLLGALSFGASPDEVDQSKNNRVVIDDKFLKDHVVVDGHWYTKEAWAKEKIESNDALLWLLSGGTKGSKTSGTKPSGSGKDPLEHLLNPDRKGGSRKRPKAMTSEEVLADLYGINTRKLKPVDLLADITGIASILGTPGKAAKTPKAKNPVTQLSASLGLDTSAFDKNATHVKGTAKDLDGLRIHPKVNVDGIPAALSATAALRSLLDSLHDRNIHVTVTKTTNANLAEATVVGRKGHADGGTVPGARYPYVDSMLVPLAGTEEIISNRYGQADRNRAALKAANAGAKLAVVGYAGGGTVGSASTVTPQMTAAIDYSRLATAIANQIPGFRGTRDAHIAALRTVLREMPVQRVPADLMYGMSL